jgi:hypothetical protein
VQASNRGWDKTAQVHAPACLRAQSSILKHLGAGRIDVSGLPENRLLALARYGLSAKASALRDLKELRRTATLVAWFSART